MSRQVTLKYVPRPCQLLIHNMRKQHRYIVAVCHRGMGKSTASMVELLFGALDKKGVYIYLAPEKSQGKKVAWDQLTNLALQVPHTKINKAELSILFPNDSVIYFLGAKDVDRIRGIHPSGVVVDEVADMPYDLWESALYGSLQIHKAWVIFIGTPKGDDLFYKLFMWGMDRYRHSWNSCLIDVYNSGVYTPERIEELKQDIGSEEAWNREYLCQFTGAVGGAYYNNIINDITKMGRVGTFPYNRSMPVITAWDLGLSDKTCIWFAQPVIGSNMLRIIDFYEAAEKDFNEHIKVINSKPYNYAYHILPHDVAKRNGDNKHSRLDTLRHFNMRVEILPKTNSVAEDIAVVQSKLYSCEFDRNEAVLFGLAHLRGHRSKRDKITGEYLPEQARTIHTDAADAFRYLMLGAKPYQLPHQIRSNQPEYSPMKYALNRMRKNGNKLR